MNFWWRLTAALGLCILVVSCSAPDEQISEGGRMADILAFERTGWELVVDHVSDTALAALVAAGAILGGAGVVFAVPPLVALGATALAQAANAKVATEWFKRHLPEGTIALIAASILFVLPAAPGAGPSDGALTLERTGTR